MSVTIDCGEGKHDICSGAGTDAYLIPQLSGEPFNCGCRCHHDGRGVACSECGPKVTRGPVPASNPDLPGEWQAVVDAAVPRPSEDADS